MNFFTKHPRFASALVIIAPIIVAACTHTYLAYKKEAVVYIGLLHSLTGPLSQTEHSILSFEHFAIDKINQEGGLLGHRICPIVRDFSNNSSLAKKITKEFLEKDKVAAIFDGGSSSTIFALQPVLEKHNTLFFFSQNNIGMMTSPNIIFCNSAVNNQVLPALEESVRLFGNKIFLLGKDSRAPGHPRSYDSPVAHVIVNEYCKAHGIEVTGDVLLENNAPKQLNDAIEAIQKTAPSFIFCTSSTDLNIDIVNAIDKAKIETPLIWTRFEFSHIATTGKEKLKTHLFTNSYTRVITTPANQNFVATISNKLGFAQAISTHEVSALSALQLWVAAVKKCNSFDPDKVRAALRDNIYIETPQGPLTLDPETFYAYKKSVLVRYNPYGVLQFLWYSPYPLKPEPFPTFKPKEYWLKLLHAINPPEKE